MQSPKASPFELPEQALDLRQRLLEARYWSDDRTVLALHLALLLERPLMLEGPAGVGKTDLARAAAEALRRPLIRLQCYEGLDESRALYEWDYSKQMLYTQLLRDTLRAELDGVTGVRDAALRIDASASTFYSESFLVERPLLAALRSDPPAVLLIDEVDRADPEFEALLLEILSEFQVTIPELGTIRAVHKPLVLLTTNGSREMTDALRRRCLHAFLDYPSPARELSIVRMHHPGIDEKLSSDVAGFVESVRELDLRKVPAISETLDWARALLLLGATTLAPELVRNTLGALLKHEEDTRRVEQQLETLLDSSSEPPKRKASKELV